MLKKLFIITIGCLVDLISKLLVLNKLVEHQVLELFNTKFCGLNLFLTYNSGVAFGLFNNSHGYSNKIFLVLTILAILSIGYLIISNKILDPFESFSMLLILSGALGNLIDRIIYGHVIDFIDFYIIFNKKILHWYTFNLADSIICFGTGLFLYKNLRSISNNS